MNQPNHLMAPWSPFGVTAPNFIWIAAAALFSFTIFQLARLWLLVRRESKTLKDATEKIRQLRNRNPFIPGQGLSTSAYGGLAAIFAGAPYLQRAWAAFASLVINRRSHSGEDQFWAAEPAELAFSESAVFEERLNRGFFGAIPSIVTGTGLLFTFLAILIALLELKFDPKTSQFTGIEALIVGLSGKFVSSIAALLSATVFLLAEKPLFHKLSKARLGLVESLDGFVPRLSSAQILAELQRDIAEQSTAFRSFNADLSGKLKQSFNEGMGPTIQRMVEVIEDLNGLMRKAEEQKQESITGELAKLLQNIEQSISSSLLNMGDRFKESISGAAMGEFGRISDSLGGTARLLEDMNAQFQGTQSALSELVRFSKDSTAEQLALGKTQVEDLTAVLRQFMVQMNETAGSSVSHMAATLTGVVHDLSNKVTDLGSQMAATLKMNSEQATNAAAAVVERADKWSARSAAQLDQLVSQLQAHTQNIKAVEGALMSALGLFNESLPKYATLNDGLQKIVGGVSAMVSSTTAAAKSTSESQQALRDVSGQVLSQVQKLAEANRSQQNVWEGIRVSMEQYKTTFIQTERAASELLAQIVQNVDSHLEVTKRGYEQIVRIADDHFKEATQRIGASVNELGEHLDDLTDSLDRFKGKTDGHRT